MKLQPLEVRTLGKRGIAVTKMAIGLGAIGGDTWGATDDRESRHTTITASGAGRKIWPA